MTSAQHVAAACGVTESDVMFLARLTASRIQQGLSAVEAIEAAGAATVELCSRAFKSVSENDPTNEFGHRDQFLPAVYQLLQQ